MLTTTVTWVLGDGEGLPKGVEELEMQVRGLVSRTDEHLEWLARQLQRGDEIAIRVVESSAADEPHRRKPDSPTEKRRRQESYVRHMAEEFGWKIQTQE